MTRARRASTQTFSDARLARTRSDCSDSLMGLKAHQRPLHLLQGLPLPWRRVRGLHLAIDPVLGLGAVFFAQAAGVLEHAFHRFLLGVEPVQEVMITLRVRLRS